MESIGILARQAPHSAICVSESLLSSSSTVKPTPIEPLSADDITVHTEAWRLVWNQHAMHFASEWAKSGPSSCGFVHMSMSRGDATSLPPKGRILSVISEDPRAPLHWLAMVNHELDAKIAIYTRLSPQRLGQHIKLDRVDFKWLTENMDPHALSPSLERIHHAIGTRVSTDAGIIWLDGVEYLIHRQGFDRCSKRNY